MRLTVCALVALGAGCGTAPERIEIAAPTEVRQPRIDFRDARPIEQIAGKRFESTTSLSVTYGDDQFTESHVRLLRSRLETHAAHLIGKRTVVLREFAVSTNHSYSMLGGSGYIPAPGGASTGDMVLGGLLAGLVIQGIESAKASRHLSSIIRLELDGKEVRVGAWKSSSIGSVGSGLSSVVNESIDNLIAKLGALAEQASPPVSAGK